MPVYDISQHTVLNLYHVMLNSALALPSLFDTAAYYMAK
jgi:hypothetical protein